MESYDYDEYDLYVLPMVPRMDPQNVSDEGAQRPYVVSWRPSDWGKRPVPRGMEDYYDEAGFCQDRTIMASTPRLAALKAAVSSEHTTACCLRATDESGASVIYRIDQVARDKADFRGPVLEFGNYYTLTEVDE